MAFGAATDSYVQMNSPSKNNGTANVMSIRNDGTNIWRSLVQFDVTAIPGGATVDAATLTLCYPNNPNNNAQGHVHEIHAATSVWAETGVTWNTQPAFSATAIGTLTVPSSAQCLTVDVTGDVQAWVSGTSNFGWLIKDQSETGSNDAQVAYGTRENGNPAVRPQLSVTYH